MYRKKNYNKNNNFQNKTKEIFDQVVEKLQAIVDNGDYERFLKFQKNFRSYSFNNLILIFSQFPDATKVAGKSTWLKLKRELTKDAKKIWIVAPIPRQYNKKVKTIEDGEEIEKVQVVKYNAYRYVYVYDISHTTGEAIPLQSKRINCDDKLHFYNKLKEFSNVPVIEKELLGGTLGYYSEKENIIAIKDTLSINDKVAVLLHEIAHSIYDDFDYSQDRDLSEVFVESIAYIVADHFGLDTSPCSFNYILKWAKGEPKTVLELGSKIQKCANEFIEKLENFEMQELQLAA